MLDLGLRRFGVRWWAAIAIAVFVLPLYGQVDVAREAMRNGDYTTAVSVLTQAVADNPSSDAYLYLGIAHAQLRHYGDAEAMLRQGAEKYPADPRFHNELAGLYMARNDVEAARAELQSALRINSEDVYAGDLLANIDLAQGHVRSALDAWARNGGPVISKILSNGHPLDVSPWTVGRAIAFQTGETLEYPQWRTTERRLLEYGPFGEAKLEIQPTSIARRYNANIATSLKRNTRLSIPELFVQYFRWYTTRFVHLDAWDVAGSGMSFTGAYRPDKSRKRADVSLMTPLPLPGGLVVIGSGSWRSEGWNVSDVARKPSPVGFHFKSTGWRVMVKAIPDYRFEVAAGFEVTNRGTSGDIPQALAGRGNAGKFLFEASARPADRAYQSRIHVAAFMARKSVLGTLDYTGATVEMNNRLPIPHVKNWTVEWTTKGGTARGSLPVDEYFVLGTDLDAGNLLRGYAAFNKRIHRYGAAPMGTDFLLANATVDRRLGVLGQRNGMLPPLTIKGEVFLDVAKVFDRARVFQQGEVLSDGGIGLRFEAATYAAHLIFGHALRTDDHFAGVYMERRW